MNSPFQLPPFLPSYHLLISAGTGSAAVPPQASSWPPPAALALRSRAIEDFQQAQDSLTAANLKSAVRRLESAAAALSDSIERSPAASPEKGWAVSSHQEWSARIELWKRWDSTLVRLSSPSRSTSALIQGAAELLDVLREIDREGHSNFLHHVMEHLGESLLEEAEFRAGDREPDVEERISELREEGRRLHDRAHDAMFWEDPPVGHMSDDGWKVVSPRHLLAKMETHALEEALGLPLTDPRELFEAEANGQRATARMHYLTNLRMILEAFQQLSENPDNWIKATSIMTLTRSFDRIVRNLHETLGKHYVFPRYLERILTAVYGELESARERLVACVDTTDLLTKARRLQPPQGIRFFLSALRSALRSVLRMDADRSGIMAETAAWLGDPRGLDLLKELAIAAAHQGEPGGVDLLGGSWIFLR